MSNQHCVYVYAYITVVLMNMHIFSAVWNQLTDKQLKLFLNKILHQE